MAARGSFDIRSNPVARFGYRAWILARTPGALTKRTSASLRYLLRSREVANHTYELENLDEMVAAIAQAIGHADRLSGFVRELHADEELRAALSAKLRENPRRDDFPRYGKRTIDYCIVRARRPSAVAELGIHDGLGSAVILRALERNAAEGDEGRLIGFDNSDEAGWLVPGFLRERMTIKVGDVAETLGPALGEEGVDYLNSDIAPRFPCKEKALETACDHARGELVIRDEVDDGDVLPRVVERRQGRLVTFREQPRRFFMPGHLIGIGVIPPRPG